MSVVKHTPWKHEWVEESSDWAVFGCVYPPDAEGIAHQPGICTLSDFCDEDEARLIAAAPDHHAVALELDRLALVIESAVRFADPAFKEEVQALLRSNKDAIARARGEQDGGGE